MICREGKNGLWSLSQPMKALVLCDSAVSKSGSKFCQMEKDETILKKGSVACKWTDFIAQYNSYKLKWTVKHLKQSEEGTINEGF